MRRGGTSSRAALAVWALGFVLAMPASAIACDICAIYTAAHLGPSRSGPRIGVAEQYSYFATWKEGTESVPNPGERMYSSITQVFAGYEVGPRVDFQITLPIIDRSFKRLEEGVLRSGSVSGIGDLSLLGRYVAFDAVGERGSMRFSVIGGLKFPTGGTNELAAEAHDHDDDLSFDDLVDKYIGRGQSADLGQVMHGGEESGIHGHDLTLGTGSVDGVMGGDLFLSYDRFFWTTGLQYIARTEGAFEYTFANELTWIGGPGYYVLLEHDMTLGVQAVSTGETKGLDTQAGEPVGDTGITGVYLGPAVRFSWGTSLAAEVTGDLPVYQNVTGLQIVPDFRIRGAFVWRF